MAFLYTTSRDSLLFATSVIHHHSLVIASSLVLGLVGEHLTLLHRVVELCVSIAHLLGVDKELEGHWIIVIIAPRMGDGEGQRVEAKEAKSHQVAKDSAWSVLARQLRLRE